VEAAGIGPGGGRENGAVEGHDAPRQGAGPSRDAVPRTASAEAELSGAGMRCPVGAERASDQAAAGEEGFEFHGRPAGFVMSVEFEIAGQQFTALNGGPQFSFSEAISFEVRCTSQQEVDTYWERLTADGGEEVQCGWLKDRFGLSWQIVPEALGRLASDPDPARSGRVMNAMYGMKKIDIAALERAYAGVCEPTGERRR